MEFEDQPLAVTIESAGQRRVLLGTLTRAANARQPRPGLLLLHDLGGVRPSFLETARGLAAHGYVVLTPDLYSGSRRWLALPRLVSGAALRPLRGQALDDLRAALRALASRDDVDSARLAVLGFSLGGAYALQLACIEPMVRVAGAFCAQVPRPLAALRDACDIVASYAGRDLTCHGIPGRLERALSQFGIAHDLKTYAMVRHAFYDPGAATYNALAAHDAWQRTLGFMRLRLGEAE